MNIMDDRQVEKLYWLIQFGVSCHIQILMILIIIVLM
ncbi:hypothetical protein BACFRA24663_01605 [Bacteroides fragilis]